MNCLIASIIFISKLFALDNSYEHKDSTLYGEEWCAYCYRNLNNVDSVFHENISYMNNLLGSENEYKLECIEDNKRREEITEFLWVVSLMSGRRFTEPSDPHKSIRIKKNKIKELEQWFYEHKHLITIDLLRRYYCSLYPPIMDFEDLINYYDCLKGVD